MGRPRFEIGEISSNVSFDSNLTSTGKYRARTRVRCQDGKIRAVSALGRSKTAARRNCLEAAKRRAQQGNGDITHDSPMTTLISKWWEQEEKRVQSGELRQVTLHKYERSRDRIIDGLGSLRIREANAARVSAFISDYGNGFYTVEQDLKRCLNSILDLALVLGIAEYNFVPSLQTLKPTVQGVATYSDDDIQTIRRAVRDYEDGGSNKIKANGRKKGGRARERYLADFVDMMLSTGCRISEMLGLRWEDVDLEGDEATVTVVGIVRMQKADKASGRPYLYWEPTGKTKSAFRTIRIGEYAKNVLVRLRDEDEKGSIYIFSNVQGGLMSPHNVRRALRTACNEAELTLEGGKTHTFRKTVATLIENADGLRTASMLLGHSNTQITEQAYVNRSSEVPALSPILDEMLAVVP